MNMHDTAPQTIDLLIEDFEANGAASAVVQRLSQ